MNEKATLKKLISTLQTAVSNDGFTKTVVETAIEQLKGLNHKYDYEKYPVLIGTEKFSGTSGNTPTNLAEALLWKLGKWKVYKTFVSNYNDEDKKVTKDGGVVFSAFAKHLKNNENPIFDQHVIRGLWAICGNFTSEEKKKCKSFLFNVKNQWKTPGSGNVAIECYELFVKHINDLVATNNGATKGEIDHLLMPLGQAIKEATDSYTAFHKLCGWPGDG